MCVCVLLLELELWTLCDQMVHGSIFEPKRRISMHISKDHEIAHS